MGTYSYKSTVDLDNVLQIKIRKYRLNVELTLKDKFSNKWREYKSGQKFYLINRNLFVSTNIISEQKPEDIGSMFQIDMDEKFFKINQPNIFKEYEN